MPFFSADISDGLMFPQRPFLERFAQAVQCGFEAVEFCQPYKYSVEDILHFLQDDSYSETLELACLGMHTHETKDPNMLGYMGYAAIPGFEKQFREDFSLSLRYARALKCKSINIFTGLPYLAFLSSRPTDTTSANDGDSSPTKSELNGHDEKLGLDEEDDTSPNDNNKELDQELEANSLERKESNESTSRSAVDFPKHSVPCFSLPPATASGMSSTTRAEIAAATKGLIEGKFALPHENTEAVFSRNISLQCDISAKSSSPVSKLDLACSICPLPQRLTFSFPLPKENTLSLGAGLIVDDADGFLSNLSKAVNATFAKEVSQQKIEVNAQNASFYLDSLSTLTLISNLQWAMQQVQSESGPIGDVQLLLEPVSDIPGYFMNSIHKAIRVISACNQPSVNTGSSKKRKIRLPVALLFDAYHLQRLHGNLGELLESVISIVGHIQVASVPRRREPDRGEVNFMYLLKRIDKLGYEGWVGLEYAPTLGRTKLGLKPWLSQYQRKRQSSAGVLFCAMGKQGKPYILLGKSHKKGHEWGLFWGRPDQTDSDVPFTAAREATEESLGVIATQELLYRALTDTRYHIKFPWLGLYIVSLGELGSRERESLIDAYINARKNNELSSCQMEMLEISWFDASEIYKGLLLKKKQNLPKLKEFFKRELTRGMEEVPQFKIFCERGGLAIAPLQDLVMNSSDAMSVRNWHSAPP